MKIINLNKEWDFIISNTHNQWHKNNSLKKELIFILQNLLIKISDRSINKANKIYLQKIYFKTKIKFLET